MREIKFEYILLKNDIVVGKEKLLLEDIEQKNKNEFCYDLLDTDERVVKRQYTGLKDKNRIEIFEGDILIAKNKKDSKDNDWIGIVEDNNYGWLALKYKDYINPSWMGALSTPVNEPQNASWIMNNCEVIGNIYENKELLDEVSKNTILIN